MQIDAVGNPSWQAQIKGTKEWSLEPPPECAHICDPLLKVTVNPGEISKCSFRGLWLVHCGSHDNLSYGQAPVLHACECMGRSSENQGCPVKTTILFALI